jgi:hypothetical protein
MRLWISVPISVAVAAGVLAVYGLNYFYGPLDYLATTAACDLEGGLRVNGTDYVDGYWRAPARYDTDCDSCKNQVARGDFLYVEAGPLARAEAPDTKYVRFELVQVGAASCLPSGHFESPPPGMCVSEIPLSGKPQSRYFVRASTQDEHGSYGVELQSVRRSVYDRLEKKVIATFHYFEGGTPAERAGRFSWSYNCGSPKDHPLDSNRFIRQVLHDERAKNKRGVKK